MAGNELLNKALQYAAHSWPVFPCRLDKSPLTGHGFKDATTDAEQIKAWWRQYPDASIGSPTGPEGNGFLVLDVDQPAGPETLGKLEKAHAPMPDTRQQRTGGGGMQYFFVYPEGLIIHNSAGKLGHGLDVRGNGGYVILPPSGHPSGGQYKWEKGNPLAPCPVWLLDLMLGGNQAPCPDSTSDIAPDLEGQATPYGRAALKRECASVALASEGERNETLNKAAFSLGQLVAGAQIERADVEAKLLFAANRAGLPKKEAHRTIQSGLEAGIREPRTPKSDDEIKVQPIRFEDQYPPPIPSDLVPGILRTFAEAVAESVQVPFELALCNALGAVAVAGQRKFKVQVKPGYSEGLNIYALCPLPPGERKSATVENCKRPLVEWQSQARRQAVPFIRATESERKTLEKAIEVKRAAAAKAKTYEDRQELIEEIKELEGSLPEIPVAPRLLADDFTPEALGAIMEMHEERIGLIEAEGGIFDTLAGRYSNGVPNLDAVLKFWGGEPCQIDRRGSGSIFLTEPRLTLVISPQPEVVRGLVEKPGFRGRGLLGRFLYFIPQSRLGHRKVETMPVPESLTAEWSTLLHRLLDYPWNREEHDTPIPHLIHLSEGARRQWVNFAASVEMEYRSGGEFENMTDWAGKLPGQAVRLAGLLHVTIEREPQNMPINEETMEAALGIASILAKHAKAAYAIMGSDADQECAKFILRWLTRNGSELFTARDALEKVKGRFPTMEKVNAGLAVLEERAFILPVSTEDKTGPGRRPSRKYRVNPYVRLKA